MQGTILQVLLLVHSSAARPFPLFSTLGQQFFATEWGESTLLVATTGTNAAH